MIAVALSYAREDDEPGWRGVARYARGHDYHELMRPRLAALAEFVCAAAGSDVRCRVAVDTSAILERDVAARAGLGWIGKNTNLLTTGLGSYFFIGVVLTTAALPVDEGQSDRCGTCTACLDACRPLAPGFGVETAMTIDAVRLGFRVIEVAVAMRHRPTGRGVRGFAHRGRQGVDAARAAVPRLAGLR